MLGLHHQPRGLPHVLPAETAGDRSTSYHPPPLPPNPRHPSNNNKKNYRHCSDRQQKARKPPLRGKGDKERDVWSSTGLKDHLRVLKERKAIHSRRERERQEKPRSLHTCRLMAVRSSRETASVPRLQDRFNETSGRSRKTAGTAPNRFRPASRTRSCCRLRMLSGSCDDAGKIRR